MAKDATQPTQWWANDVTPGVVLIAAALISFALQNSALAGAFDHVLHQELVFRLGAFAIETDLAHFIADGLMAIFFLYVGLELKRECVEGPFRYPREAALPLIGAVGGMIAPALIYVAIAAPFSADYLPGWAIPAATDIAFALGVLALLGKAVPAELRLFLLALAIADDLGAILIIALFYSDTLVGWALGGATLTFLAMLFLNYIGLKRLGAYWLLAIVLWVFMLLSGVHATIAGVAAAITIPMRAGDGRSPLIAAEHELKPWVLLGVMPIFALANAGAPLGDAAGAFAHPVTFAVALGLCLGKPLGITAAVMLGAAAMKQELPMPRGQLIGLSMIAGVGFTMSLFVGALAFGSESALTAPTRLGVLIGSGLSAALGLFVLSRTLKAPRA